MTRSVLAEVLAERQRQDEKWGVQSHEPGDWLLILSEEFGEVAKEVNEVKFRCKSTLDYRTELLQTAAVCVAAVEALDRGQNS